MKQTPMTPQEVAERILSERKAVKRIKARLYPIGRWTKVNGRAKA